MGVYSVRMADITDLTLEMEDTVYNIMEQSEVDVCEEIVVDGKILLQDALIAYELISSHGSNSVGDTLLQAITDIYKWVENDLIPEEAVL